MTFEPKVFDCTPVKSAPLVIVMNLTGQADYTDCFDYARHIKTLIYLAHQSPGGERKDIHFLLGDTGYLLT